MYAKSLRLGGIMWINPRIDDKRDENDLLHNYFC